MPGPRGKASNVFLHLSPWDLPEKPPGWGWGYQKYRPTPLCQASWPPEESGARTSSFAAVLGYLVG